MMSIYPTYTVEELIFKGLLEPPLDGNHGQLHPKTSDFKKTGIPFIMANDLLDGEIQYGTCAYISPQTAGTLRKGFAKPEDILITHKGTIGRTAIVDHKFEEIVLTPQVTYYRVKKGIDNIFLKYYFDSPYFQAILHSAAGSGSTRPYIGITAQRKLPILLPPLVIQKGIVKMLLPFDEKISNNNKHLKMLSEMIFTIYKQTFGCVWNTTTSFMGFSISNVFEHVNEVRDKNKEERDYPVLSVVKEGIFKTSEDVFTKQVYSKSTKNYKIVRRNQVAYNPARANIGSIAMLKEYDVGLVSPIYTVFEMKDTITPTFFYYYMKQPIFQEMIKHHAIGTTRQNFPFEAFKMFPMVVPPMELQLKFEEIAKPIEQKIAKLKEENEVLAEIRDTLLPKLMSGELPVEVGEN